MIALFNLLSLLLTIYLWLVIIQVILSNLVRFGMVQLQHPGLIGFYNFLIRITEPALKPIRGLLERVGFGNIGGIDISPVILILAIYFLRDLFVYDLARAVT